MLWVRSNLRRESSGVWCEAGLNALISALGFLTKRFCQNLLVKHSKVLRYSVRDEPIGLA
ncbi:hypothetical protein FHS16_000065 [Paenibacillus endophyticus]|uniref:Uncharacterized protein n=1 Tax=Paenibacillus endophyticus TaxID=1294268 RepID=A0A7W5C2J1_9BACL|nr:hypothetical protein [Paenibacillus endophyticus]